MKQFKLTVFVVACAWLSSCDQGTVTPTGDVPVQLGVSFSGNSLSSFSKEIALLAADSLRVDSAIVVFSKIKFESHDSLEVDTADSETGEKEGEDDLNVKFKGPFVVHIRNPLVIDLGQRMIPAGTYNTIKFKIHRLKLGEPHEDSDERASGHWITADSLPVGSSIIVWGTVLKSGTWTPFEFRFNEDVEFKIRGTFEIPNTTSTVAIAMDFNVPLWFRNPDTGGWLDPTDLSDFNRSLFRRAIHIAFGKGKCGSDRDHDGHPDD